MGSSRAAWHRRAGPAALFGRGRPFFRPPSLLLRRSERLLMMPAIVAASRFAFFLFFVGCFITGRTHKRKAWATRWVGGLVGGWCGPSQGQINENEMEISGRLRGQMGEHDEMKKNSLTLFCLLRLCGAAWNTNKISTNASFRFDLCIFFPFSATKRELSERRVRKMCLSFRIYDFVRVFFVFFLKRRTARRWSRCSLVGVLWEIRWHFIGPLPPVEAFIDELTPSLLQTVFL